jgi:NADH-quinone oxidoreductase subunit E
MPSFNASELHTLVEDYREQKTSLVSLLQDIQTQCGYLPKEQLQYVSKALEIPLSKIFCIASFYSSFSLEPRGENLISVCLGTACHVKNGENLFSLLGRELGLDNSKETTSDRRFTLEKVRCLGC